MTLKFKISKQMIIATIVSTLTLPDSNHLAYETWEVYQYWIPISILYFWILHNIWLPCQALILIDILIRKGNIHKLCKQAENCGKYQFEGNTYSTRT